MPLWRFVMLMHKIMTRSYSGMVEMLSEVEAIMISMKINPDHIAYLLRGIDNFIRAFEKDDGKAAQDALDYITSLRSFSVKKAEK